MTASPPPATFVVPSALPNASRAFVAEVRICNGMFQFRTHPNHAWVHSRGADEVLASIPIEYAAPLASWAHDRLLYLRDATRDDRLLIAEAGPAVEDHAAFPDAMARLANTGATIGRLIELHAVASFALDAQAQQAEADEDVPF